MIGVYVNVGAITLGTILGLLLKKVLKENIKNTLIQAIGVCVVIVGIMDALKTTNVVLLILSMVIGGLIGSMLNIQNGIEKFGKAIEHKLVKSESATFGKAFVDSSLIFCIGAMVVYGSIQSGLGDPKTLYTKAILDGVIALTLASTLGWGVILSIIPVFIIEATITLLASLIAPYATADFLAELSGIGGCLVFTIGINLLGIKEIKTANLSPAILGCLVVFLL
ncbi:MAG: DUF554 domain-containing protein [Clostridia bacterium]